MKRNQCPSEKLGMSHPRMRAKVNFYSLFKRNKMDYDKCKVNYIIV